MERLLNFLVGIRRLPPLSELSGDEERMLFELRARWQERGALTVADAYDLAKGSSSITSYRRLIALKDKGLELHQLIESIGKSRELSLAATKTEEAVMWAIKWITR